MLIEENFLLELLRVYLVVPLKYIFSDALCWRLFHRVEKTLQLPVTEVHF